MYRALLLLQGCVKYVLLEEVGLEQQVCSQTLSSGPYPLLQITTPHTCPCEQQADKPSLSESRAAIGRRADERKARRLEELRQLPDSLPRVGLRCWTWCT